MEKECEIGCGYKQWDESENSHFKFLHFVGYIFGGILRDVSNDDGVRNLVGILIVCWCMNRYYLIIKIWLL